jgi:hypothetical protein
VIIRRSPHEGEDSEVLVADPPTTLVDGRHEERGPAERSLAS